MRNNIKIVEGRIFTPGLYEVIVGKKIADRVSGVDIGSTINIQRKNWKVVGLFAADDSSFESEIWGDYDAMAPAIGRNGGCESLTVRLTNPADAGVLRQRHSRQSADPGAGRLGEESITRTWRAARARR